MAKKRQSFFTMDELKNNVFMVDENEKKVFMPNEIFDDLLDGFDGHAKAKSTTHIAYAYTYTYLAHYMYRYCKYYDSEGIGIDEAKIKQVMGFPAKSDAYTYITKKGGVLDDLGYIEKVSDKPVEAVLSKVESETREIDYFLMESNYPEIYKKTNRKISFPAKAFDRYKDGDNGDATGTYYNIDNTHMIDFDVFSFCMDDAELGVEGFYLYSFMLKNYDTHQSGFDCSHADFVKLTGLSISVVKKQLRNLEERGMITNDHKPYCVGHKEWQKPKSNTYTVLPFTKFILNESDFVKIPEGRTVNAKEYEEEIGFIVYGDNDGEIEVSVDYDDKSNGKRSKAIQIVGESLYIDKNGDEIILPF